VRVIPELGSLNCCREPRAAGQDQQKQDQNDFDRTKKLFEDKLISREDFEKSQRHAQTAREETGTPTDALQIVAKASPRTVPPSAARLYAPPSTAHPRHPHQEG
jgi:hypothetical protein